METIELLKLAGVIIIGYFVLKFIWNLVSGLIKTLLVIVLIVVGIYFIKPSLLHGVFGKERVENVAKEVSDTTNEAVDSGKKILIKEADSLKKDVKKKASEAVTL